MRIANILFYTSGRMELNLAQSQRGKLREFTDLGHNPKQFRICLTPSNSKNVQRVLAFLSEDKFYVDINTNQLIHFHVHLFLFRYPPYGPFSLQTRDKTGVPGIDLAIPGPFSSPPPPISSHLYQTIVIVTLCLHISI